MGKLCKHITAAILKRTCQVVDYCQYLAMIAVSSDVTSCILIEIYQLFCGNMLPPSSGFSEVSLSFYWTTCHHIPEDISSVTSMRTSKLTVPYLTVCTFQLQFHDLFTVLYSHLQVG